MHFGLELSVLACKYLRCIEVEKSSDTSSASNFVPEMAYIQNGDNQTYLPREMFTIHTRTMIYFFCFEFLDMLYLIPMLNKESKFKVSKKGQDHAKIY